jgi:hypothetical protein
LAILVDQRFKAGGAIIYHPPATINQAQA